jgi:two-component system sensor histidine kinase FlrB
MTAKRTCSGIQAAYSRAMSRHVTKLEDLITRVQSASESIGQSCQELQGLAQTLGAELERDRQNRLWAERLAPGGDVVMELAHEIRNPLSSIELCASMLEGEPAAQIVRSVRLLNHSLTNVLQFGQAIHPNPEPISVSRLLEGIREFLQAIAEQKRIRIETGTDSNCYAMADYELMHRMLLNLVLNALRETPTDGMVRLTARVAGSDVVLEVEDTGPGIHDEALARIFDPMFSTHKEGFGLGLPIAKRIVDSHNGLIQVESSSSGTRFIIRLRDAAMDGWRNDTEVVSEPTAGRRR